MISHRTALRDDTADGTGTHSTTRDITNAYLRQSRMHVTMARVQWHEARRSRRRSRAGRALGFSGAIPGVGKGLIKIQIERGTRATVTPKPFFFSDASSSLTTTP